mmetsp:Transcript_74917/g.141283  ORF Transcript_74917/g.141283 Transcript_74917/m.141283 type:complete len:131 (+) Transcript_74917:1282-1674(+)
MTECMEVVFLAHQARIPRQENATHVSCVPEARPAVAIPRHAKHVRWVFFQMLAVPHVHNAVLGDSPMSVNHLVALIVWRGILRVTVEAGIVMNVPWANSSPLWAHPIACTAERIRKPNPQEVFPSNNATA